MGLPDDRVIRFAHLLWTRMRYLLGAAILGGNFLIAAAVVQTPPIKAPDQMIAPDVVG
jgi:hypothetical protein